MKKLMMILAVVVLATACEGPPGPPGPMGPAGNSNMLVVDNIYVAPNGWAEYKEDNEFRYYFCDIEMPELTRTRFIEGDYATFWKFDEPGTDGPVTVQIREGMVMYKSYVNDQRETVLYSETIFCEYSIGMMRITFRTSDFDRGRPADTMYFRFVVSW